MSLIRALSNELEARDDDSLRSLFAARPDLMSPPVPDFAALAARASSRVSVQRALERLTKPQLQVIEAVHLTTNTDTGHSVSAVELKKVIAGATIAGLEPILHGLQDLALLQRVDPPSGFSDSPSRHRYYLPVGSLKEVIGIYPAGLGRSYTELVRLLPAFAQRVVQIVSELRTAGADIKEAGSPFEAALALQHWTSSPERLETILSKAPERTRTLLDRFGTWAMGAVPQAQRRLSLAKEAPDVGPVDWLLARGLLVPLDAAHVELPHSVGLALRGGAIIPNFLRKPPVPTLGETSALLRRNAALGAIAETLRLCSELVAAVRAQPLTTLRTGGVGVRELRRLADAIRLEVGETALLLELCALSGLLRLDVDSSTWVQPSPLEWLELPRKEQWLWLVNAWLSSERVPSMVGQPSPGQMGVPGPAAAATQSVNSRNRSPVQPASTGHRGQGSTAINALSGEAQRPDAPLVRRRVLEILAELTTEAGAPDGRAPVLDAAVVLERADWAQPRMTRRFNTLVDGILHEAELLGLMGSGALTQLGSAIAADRPDEALEILGEHLPAALNHFLLQADLTAVAPGYLSPELSRRLQGMADAEGQGPATIYRFSQESIRRALDSGFDAASLLAFLREHSATAVPQPLEYMVADTASRHGRLRVATAAAFIQSDDEAAITDLLAEPGASSLGLVKLAPTVLTSAASPRETARVLRELGLTPTLDEKDSGVRLKRSLAVAAARPVYTAPRAAPSEDDVDAQLATLRQHHRVAGSSGFSGAETVTQLGLEALHRAIRLRQAVSINVVDGEGNAVEETVVPVSVSGGRVRVFDPRRDTERVLSLHRIIDVGPANVIRSADRAPEPDQPLTTRGE
ncbi:helicase-associated domain-containing protein [Arthrobacter sp. M4]|uniref:helicase-associated domain-containing protein n=1 Tax=Arthrobacter sp. M4 TaxID=218160 RepID=UPI001CDD7D8D|nr:helicase-associated domain-containing protein [Arthrobacter sp. M4]MCA4133822.1 helicase-associated domain-containing protein [Arthrobacter sp. M4]